MKSKTTGRNCFASTFIITCCLLLSSQSNAGVDSCLNLALDSANPKDLQKAANFAINHPTCLDNLIPPTLVPYVALSGSLDVANKSGALNQVGLAFGNNYQQCRNNFDPGKTSVKKMAPVLKPVCDTLGMNCKMFESQGADEINSQLTSEVPLLSLLPCSCAAATSGLGVDKLAELVKSTEQCSGTLVDAGKYLGKAATGAYHAGESVLGAGSDTLGYGAKLLGEFTGAVQDFGCLMSGGIFGGCPSADNKAATAFCKNHSGLETYTKGLDFVGCNDGSYCGVGGNGQVICSNKAATQAMMDTLAKEQQEVENFNAQWCPNKRDILNASYSPKCHGKNCKIGVGFVLASYNAECSKQSVIEGPVWDQVFSKKYIEKMKAQIQESVINDPQADPFEVLAYYDCRPFLGRKDEALCGGTWGFVECKKLVDQHRLKTCATPQNNQRYSLPAITSFPNIINAAAITNGSLARTAQPTNRNETPMLVSDSFLANAAKKGCRPLLGRRDQLLCDNQAGYEECVQAVNRNFIKQCNNALTGDIFPVAARPR
ncbi:MAG: hypothetical protein ACREPB_09310 [Arenimonas sp.]